MTGPEHFANAESDLDNAAHASDKGRLDDMTYWMQAAQVHATLALAAVAADSFLMHPEDRAAWDHATGRIQDSPAVTP